MLHIESQICVASTKAKVQWEREEEQEEVDLESDFCRYREEVAGFTDEGAQWLARCRGSHDRVRRLGGDSVVVWCRSIEGVEQSLVDVFKVDIARKFV